MTEKRPKLRPLSTMTAEEEDVWRDTWLKFYADSMALLRHTERLESLVKCHKTSVDWLIENRFDIDGLIENGMADEMKLEIDEDAIC